MVHKRRIDMTVNVVCVVLYGTSRKRLGSRTASFTELQEYPLAVYRNHRSRFAWMTSRRGTREEKRREEKRREEKRREDRGRLR